MTLLRTPSDPRMSVERIDQLSDVIVDVDNHLEEVATQAIVTAQWQSADSTYVKDRDLWSAVAEHLSKFVESDEIDADDITDADRAELQTFRAVAKVFATWADARAEWCRAVGQLFQGDPKAASLGFRKAVDSFDLVLALSAEGPAADAGVAAAASSMLPIVRLRRATADYQELLAQGSMAMLAGTYDKAMSSYLTAQGAISQVLKDIPSDLDYLRDGIDLDWASASSLYDFSAFFAAYTAGDFEAATAAATRMVDALTLTEEKQREMEVVAWLPAAWQLQTGLYRGYLSLAKAEQAIDSGHWQEAREQVEAARSVWVGTAVHAVGSGLAPGRSIAEGLQRLASTVLPTLRRRVRREEDLRSKISALEAELRNARKLEVKGEHVVAGGNHISGGIKAGGDVKNVGVVGDVIGSTIMDSFKFVSKSGASDELKKGLEELHQAMDVAVKKMQAEDKGDPETAVERLDSFAREAVKKKPLGQSLKVLGDAIIDAVGSAAEAAAPVVNSVRAVLKLLGVPVP